MAAGCACSSLKRGEVWQTCLDLFLIRGLLLVLNLCGSLGIFSGSLDDEESLH